MRSRRWNLFHLVILQICFLVLVVSARVHAARRPVPTPSPSPSLAPLAARDAMSVRLQKSLDGFLPQLGNLEPWQTRIFQEEVLPQSSRFVRDFRTQGNGLSVDVDAESIRNYLRFYGPKSLKREKPQILLVIRPEPGCELCAQNFPVIQKLVTARLERRGLEIVAAKPEQVDPKLTAQALDERVAAQSSELKTVGSLVVEWKKADDDVDSVHADELRFIVRSSLVIRDVSKSEGQLEIFDTGSFEKTVNQLLTDFFTELGSKIDHAPVQVADAEKQGYVLELTGVNGFAHYAKLKGMILAQAQAPAGGSDHGIVIEEQKVARGKMVFSVYTDKALSDVKALFSKLDLNGAGAPVQMEIR